MVEAAMAPEDMIDMVPSGLPLFGFGSNGSTGNGAAGEDSPGTGFSPASGRISSGVGLARFSRLLAGFGSSRGAFDAGPCHIEAFG